MSEDWGQYFRELKQRHAEQGIPEVEITVRERGVIDVADLSGTPASMAKKLADIGGEVYAGRSVAHHSADYYRDRKHERYGDLKKSAFDATFIWVVWKSPELGAAASIQYRQTVTKGGKPGFSFVSARVASRTGTRGIEQSKQFDQWLVELLNKKEKEV